MTTPPGLAGAAASDVARWLVGSPGAAYAWVFAIEALLFVLSARLAARIGQSEQGEFRIDPDARETLPSDASVAANSRNDYHLPALERG